MKLFQIENEIWKLIDDTKNDERELLMFRTMFRMFNIKISRLVKRARTIKKLTSNKKSVPRDGN